MRKRFFLRTLLINCIVLTFSSIPFVAYGLDKDTTNFYAQNNILFYEGCTESGSDSVDICSASLPEETKQFLKSNDVLAKVKKNLERYKYAEEKTGIPWAAIAALHWREAGMASDASISNGQKLTSDGSCYSNVDHQKICGDANQDAVAAAKHLISNAKEVYGITLTENSSFKDWANAFLAYNRGHMYKDAGATYDQSPYVMNGFDKDHMNMKWIHADSWYNGTQLNSVEGTADGDLAGAMAVFAYLCGTNDLTVNSDDTTGVAGVTESDSDSDDSGDSCLGDFVYYSQNDSRWANESFDNCGTIGECGCGPSSFAMMANMMLDKTVTPSDTTKLACKFGDCSSIGSLSTITKHLSDYYDFEYQQVSATDLNDAIEKISELLKDGWMIHTSNSGHYVGIRGITEDGKWLVADSGAAEKTSTTPQDPEKWAAGEGWGTNGVRPINLDNIHAFRNPNSTACNKTDSCDDESGGDGELADGGYSSAEEAEKAIMEKYKKEANPTELGSSSCSTNYDNCVTFSKWFIKEYTGIDPRSFRGNGGELAGNFYNACHGKYPKLTKSSTPSVYSVGSWYPPVPGATGSLGHTGVVVGINKSEDKILIAQAGWCNPEFTGVGEYKLSEFDGKGVFVNINEYIKGGLK